GRYRHPTRRLPDYRRVDDADVPLVEPLRFGDGTAAALEGLAIDDRRRHAGDLLLAQGVAVVLPARLGVAVGHRVGTGDVQVVLHHHHVAALVAVLQAAKGQV